MTRALSLRLGLAGLGTAGRSVAQAVDKVPGYVFAAGADNRKEALEQYRAKHGIDVFDSITDMCRSKDVNVVYVATPNPLHAEHAIIAAEHGKHVIVEKPMAITLDECDRVIAAAEKNRVKLMVAHTRSLNPPIRKMREIISGGKIGRVIQINTWRYAPWLLRPRLPVELDTRLGGGVCYRQAPHQVDIVRLLGGGLVKSVKAVAGRWDPKNAAEGNYTAFVEFEDQTAATLVYNGYGYFDDAELTHAANAEGNTLGAGQKLRKAAQEGLLTKEDSRSGLAFQIEGRNEGSDSHQPFFGLTLVSCERGDLRQSRDGIFIYDENGVSEVPCPEWRGPLAVELEEFRKAVAADTAAPHDGRWGKATLEVCLAILQSSRESREIQLSHQVPSPY
jgi:phthalate 4,5-cis-dihydrodiol dehydrogenase